MLFHHVKKDIVCRIAYKLVETWPFDSESNLIELNTNK